MKRKILATLLASVMALSLIGCGAKEAPAADAPAAEAEAPAAEEAAEPDTTREPVPAAESPRNPRRLRTGRNRGVEAAERV